MRRAVFVDTWGWLCLAEPRESAHAAVVALRKLHAQQQITWLTTDFVLDGTFTRLFKRLGFGQARRYCDQLLASQRSGHLCVEWITPERFAESYRIRLQLGDKGEISFTDLTSFTVMKELGITQVISADAHFVKVNLGFELLPA